MAQKPIRAIVEACVSERDGNVREGQRLAAQVVCDQIRETMDGKEDGAFTQERIKEIQIQDLFEAFCNYDGTLDMDNGDAVKEAVTAAAFPTITSTLISSMLIPEYNYALGDVMELVTVVPATTLKETIVGFGATDGLEMLGEAVQYAETSMAEKYVTIINRKFGRMIAVTREAVTFNQTGQVLGRAGKIGNKAGLHKHQIIIQKAVGIACSATGEAATGNFVYKGTGAAIFSSDHDAIDGQTNDNTTTTALGHTGLTDIELLFASILDEKGDRIMVVPNVLLVPRALRIKAKQILGNDNEFDTANRNFNPFKGEYRQVTSPFLDDDSAVDYYLGEFAKQTVWSEAWPLRVERDSGSFSNDTIARVKVSYMGNAGCTDYRYAAKADVT